MATLFLLLTAQAQNDSLALTKYQGDTLVNDMDNMVAGKEYIGCLRGRHYVLTQKRGHIESDSVHYIVNVLDDKLQLMYSKTVYSIHTSFSLKQSPEKCNQILIWKNQLLLFTTRVEEVRAKKGVKYTNLYYQIIDTATLDCSEPVQIQHQETVYVDYSFAISPDGAKLGVFCYGLMIGVTTFDRLPDSLYNPVYILNEFITRVKNSYYVKLSKAIDNVGNAYITFKEYIPSPSTDKYLPSHGDLIKYKLLVFFKVSGICQKKELVFSARQINFDMIMCQKELTGWIFAGMKGIRTVAVDISNSSISEIVDHPFPDTFKSLVFAENEESEYAVRKCIPQPDGAFILIAEIMSRSKSALNKNTNEYIVEFEEILVTKFASDLTILWTRSIPENQLKCSARQGNGFYPYVTNGNSQLIHMSFTAIESEGIVYVILNDQFYWHHRYLQGATMEETFLFPRCIAMYRVSQNDVASNRIQYSGSSNEFLMVPSLSSNLSDRSIIVYMGGSKASDTRAYSFYFMRIADL